ncbi:TonB-dependent siderophore receptor [Pseudomonas lundensis]|nr:TonB-dependent siderophore receptor [Pseudomonas lundensis]MCT8951358.1 TonB-dependent siderophore receptor [Pseudomonas lundensis]NNA14846.1 TonB-dependent siderophore receptor [Pseudomonas lundensis]NNA35708.1 TonB-dependent siderophore receptor [Pseudomonas lundensis]QOF91371.1 TonB-dependent siderophore receptor [Pseudomonas lundensis]
MLRTPFAPLRLTPIAAALIGAMSAPAALAESPVNTPLTLDPTAVSAEAPQHTALPAVYSGGQVARGAELGVLGNQDIMDVPFTMSSYTSQLIEDQQAESLGDVLLNDASVRQSFGYGNASQIFVIRGLPLTTDDVSYNGLFGVLPRQMISSDSLERVEVFKGPNAFINGVTPTGSGVGGGINLQPKRAEDTPTRRFTTDISNNGRIGEHLDLGQRFGAENQFGVRMNLAQREGDTAIDNENQRTKLFALGLDYRGDRLRVSTDFGYQKQRINGNRNTVYLGSALTDIPHAPDADHNYSQKWTSTDLEDTFGMARAEYDLSDHWTAYAAAGAKHTREVGDYSTPTLVNSAGATTASNMFVAHDEDNRSAMAGLRGMFQTGPVSHQVNLGVSGIWTQQRSAYDLSGTFSNNLYDTVDVPKPAPGKYVGGDINDPGIVGKTINRSVAISDTLGFVDDRVLLTYGLRKQTLKVDGWNYQGNRSAAYDESITTPVYGIVLKPWENVSVYANRIEGLAQGPTAPASAGGMPVTNAGEVFAPARSKQVEAGIKYDKGTFGASLGVYRIEKPSDGYTNADGTYVRQGTQRNRGVELNLYGEPIDGLRLLAGATLMDTALKGTKNGANDGNRAIGVPKFQYNLGADWDVPGLQGVALNARMLRTGGQYANEANTLSIPAWNRFDLGARYSFDVEQRAVTLRANLENVANTRYWASANGGYLSQGEPRLLKVSATVDF